MNRSEQINELATALAKVQGSLNGARKDSNNPHFKSRYADLESVWDACRKQLSDNGLSVTQVPMCSDGKNILVSLLMHSSGQWIESQMELPVQKPGSQELGSCLSYCRRYALAALVGIYQTDDDGEEAEKQNRSSKSSASNKSKDLEDGVKMGPEEIKVIASWHTKFPMVADGFLKRYNSPDLTHLPREVYPQMDRQYRALWAAKQQSEGKSRGVS